MDELQYNAIKQESDQLKDLNRRLNIVLDNVLIERDRLKERNRGWNEWADNTMTELQAVKEKRDQLLLAWRTANREREEFKIGHDRYEFIRKLNVTQFQELFIRNIKESIAFDDLVDATRLAP